MTFKQKSHQVLLDSHTLQTQFLQPAASVASLGACAQTLQSSPRSGSPPEGRHRLLHSPSPLRVRGPEPADHTARVPCRPQETWPRQEFTVEAKKLATPQKQSLDLLTRYASISINLIKIQSKELLGPGQPTRTPMWTMPSSSALLPGRKSPPTGRKTVNTYLISTRTYRGRLTRNK